jgi:DNA-directed RNA polymerase specialized sigma24 family protein
LSDNPERDDLSRFDQERVFKKLIFPVIRCLRNLGASIEDAEEIGADALRIVFRKLAENPSFIHCHRSYAIAVCRRLFFKSLKKKIGHSRIGLLPEAQLKLSYVDPIPKIELEEILLKHSCEVMKDLTPRQVEIIQMVESGTPVLHIAQQFGITEANVRTELCRARVKIDRSIRAIWRRYHD